MSSAPTATPSEPHRGRRRSTAFSDAGFTLVEMVVTLVLTGLILALMTPVLVTSTKAIATTSRLVAAQAQARLALQNLALQIESASEICLPTQFTSAGFTLRILQIVSTTDSSGALSTNYRWDQWQVSAVGHALEEEESRIQTTNSDTGITWSGTWLAVANGIVNGDAGGSAAPFSLVAPASGSPEGLAVNLLVSGGTGGTPGTIQVTADFAALGTPYSDAGASACASASPAQ